MQISRNTVATVSFIVTDHEEKVVGKTDAKRPVVALIGQGYLVPGLEKALEGHKKGDEFTVNLKPAEAFGEIDQSLIQTIDRSMFGAFPVSEGFVFEADTSMGPRAVVVKEVHEDKVVVDGNHPLAGQTLTFFVCVEDVREATEEEIQHGHAHPNGHCPSEEGEHHCCCGHHHHEDAEGVDKPHHCCGRHHHHDEQEGEGEHHCCGYHHHEDAEGVDKPHHCCGRHHHHDEQGGEGEHHCCGYHHHEDAEGVDKPHHCCGRHHHHDEQEGEGEHHCCGHHHEDAEGVDKPHHCCGRHPHHHDEQEGEGEHHCCGHHHHPHEHGEHPHFPHEDK